MKKIFSVMLAVTLIVSLCLNVNAETNSNNEAENELLTSKTSEIQLNYKAKSVVLMEAETGEILYAENENTPYPPASVTKVMTLLLTMEAVEEGKISLDDNITVSAHAASMGGSQVFLEEGETMTVDEMIKCCVIASANDCAVALAETVAGSEERFVAMMNERADALGMKNSHFENVTGLDDTVDNHVSSALDIALMSQKLIAFSKITEYASLWQDTIRDGDFTLTNTNRLVRYYDGCNGLKTGSTAKAGYCVSAAAKRDGMQLIAVVMGSDTRDERNETAKQLLDFGFHSASLYRSPEKEVGDVAIRRGLRDTVHAKREAFCAVVEKGKAQQITETVEMRSDLASPIIVGDELGKVRFTLDGEVIGECKIVATEAVKPINLLTLFLRFFSSLVGIS